ncbi:hypothetical protein [Pseudomonas fluorescens]|uniref:hypothetical protein n=1 Tax=Pseudomonas fluorescens TaxID=294 RepID=UPI000A95C9BC|nr:hypothetical protein [Pseudomonas fluorescens]
MTYVNLEGDVVTAILAGAQDPEVWPNVVELEDDDERVVAFYTSIKLPAGGA